jgi:hypothetical protein
LNTVDDSIHADKLITIEDGNIDINKSYEGIEACEIIINGGSLKVLGPTNDGNGALDYDKECIIKGGVLLAIGSNGEIVYTFTINSINTTIGKRMNTKPGFRR